MPRSPLSSPIVDELWRNAASRLGYRVVRTEAAYASSDGASIIEIGADEILDEDDAVAQLIFHELCHAITEGETGRGRVDWGLDNVPEHVTREHACLRVEAAIARRHGLRALMAPTTSYRAYYENLPSDPIAADASDPAASLAASAVARFDASSWREPIEQALADSAGCVLRGGGKIDDAFVEAAASPEPVALHPLGFELGPPGETCGSCAWLYVGGRGTPVARCRHSAPPNGDGARTSPEHPACVRWEAPLDCQACGACCREAYHSVTVSVRDPVVWQEPDLVERHGHRFEIRRAGDRCAALEEKPRGSFSCMIYEHRPRTCREFAANGRHCLDARRRVGLAVGRR